MMRQISHLFLSISLIVFSACANTEEQEEELLPNTTVELRIKNDSNFDYEGLEVEVGLTESTYGDILAGEYTAYQTFDYAYSYAFVELKIDGEIFTIQPIDFLGETKLEPGKYTYEIKAAATGMQYDRLSINLVVD